MRALLDGTFVQNVRVGFHHVLLALCLIASSYDSLNFDLKQAKWKKLKEQAEDYAARMFQVFARCKFAKRHLLLQVEHFKGHAVPEVEGDSDGEEFEGQRSSVLEGLEREEEEELASLHVAKATRFEARKPGIIRAEESSRSAKVGTLTVGEIVHVLQEGTDPVRPLPNNDGPLNRRHEYE